MSASATASSSLCVGKALADFDEALVDYLLGRPGIAALVARWIYPDYFPQSERLPAIAYTLEDGSSRQTQEEPSGIRESIDQTSSRIR